MKVSIINQVQSYPLVYIAQNARICTARKDFNIMINSEECASAHKTCEALLSKGHTTPFESVYIEWLADVRLTSLGYKKMYNRKTNPIGGWLDSYNKSSKIQVAPQETEITSYLICAGDIKVDKNAYDDLGDL